MYVLVANGFSGIIETKEELEVMSSIYSYPKFAKVKSKEDALAFLERYKRSYRGSKIIHYGEADYELGFIDVVYFIENGEVYVNCDISKVGIIKAYPSNPNVHIENKPDLIKIRITNLDLDDSLISDHCIALSIILDTIGPLFDLNITLPDISIYLAVTAYKGSKYYITDLQDIIRNRLGGISYTVR